MTLTAENGLAWAVAGALLAAGCASSGPTDDPAARRMSWISYVSGDDLRTSCRSGEPDRYRLVFNADYNQHIRTYDLTGDLTGGPAGGGAVLEARVLRAVDISRVDAADPLAVLRGVKAETRLSARQFSAFVTTLGESGAFSGMPDRLRLRSNGIYWVVNGCHEGRWFFTAYPYPDKRFVDVRFAEPLEAIDGTNVPFPALPAPGSLPTPTRDDLPPVFQLDVDAGGVIGPTHLFGPWTLTAFR